MARARGDQPAANHVQPIPLFLAEAGDDLQGFAPHGDVEAHGWVLV